MVPSDT